MATHPHRYRYSVLLAATLCLVALSAGGQKQRKPAVWFPALPITFNEERLRQAIRDTAAKFVGLREVGENRGAWVDFLNRSTGHPLGSFYCAIGLSYAYRANGVHLPVSAPGRVNAYFLDPGKVIYRRNARLRYIREPQRADFVSLFESHVEAYDEDRGWNNVDDETPIDKEAAEEAAREKRVWLIGFNTSGGRGTPEGVWRNRRKVKDIKAVSNHLTPFLEKWKSR